MLINALAHKPLPIYGDGLNIRDWLFVTDHVSALIKILQQGRVGESYLISAKNERTNLEVIECLCNLLENQIPCRFAPSYHSLIKHISDRKGHDRRYALNPSKIERELNWAPNESFESGLYKTIQWYIDNQKWAKQVMNDDYQNWLQSNYANRELNAR